MNDNVPCVILAAGQGKRMRPLTFVIPKALVIKNFQTLISRQISFYLSHFPRGKIYITIGHRGVLLKLYMRVRWPNLHYEFINTKNMANAFFLKKFHSNCKHNFILVMTCDNPIKIDLEFLYQEAAYHKVSILLVAILDETNSLPGDRIVSDNNGVVTELRKGLDSSLLASGLQLINLQKCIETVSEIPNPDFQSLWSLALGDKSVRVSSKHPQIWSAVDSPIDLFKKLHQNDE